MSVIYHSMEYSLEVNETNYHVSTWWVSVGERMLGATSTCFEDPASETLITSPRHSSHPPSIPVCHDVVTLTLLLTPSDRNLATAREREDSEAKGQTTAEESQRLAQRARR